MDCPTEQIARVIPPLARLQGQAAQIVTQIVAAVLAVSMALCTGRPSVPHAGSQEASAARPHDVEAHDAEART